jgi:hypothetical protein
MFGCRDRDEKILASWTPAASSKQVTARTTALAVNDHLQLVRDICLSSPIAKAPWVRARPTRAARPRARSRERTEPFCAARTLATSPCRAAAGQWPSDRAALRGRVTVHTPGKFSERHEAHEWQGSEGLFSLFTQAATTGTGTAGLACVARSVKGKRVHGRACQQSNTDVSSAVRPGYTNSRRT